MPDTVQLIKDGKPIEVPADQASAYVAEGYSPESTEAQVARNAQEAREANAPGVFSSGSLAVARGLTFGLSDVAGRAIGGQTFRDFANAAGEAHPYISTAGQLAGAIAPALLTGGAAGAELAGLAKLTPAGFVSNIGSRIAAASGEALGRIGSTALAGAAEGAAQSAGSYISDVALGNRDLTADGFLGAMGKGALYGGVAGGALSVASNGLIAARRLFPADELTAEGVARAKLGAQRAIGGSVDTSTQLESAGRQALEQTDRETQQFITDLEQERAQALQQAAKARNAEEGITQPPETQGSSSEPSPPNSSQPGETAASPEAPSPLASPQSPPKTARELMAAWREKYPAGAVEYDTASAAARRQRLAEWAKGFEATTPEDETIKAYFSDPMDPGRTTERLGNPDAPVAVQKVARQAAADASHRAYLDATAQATNVSKSGAELMARATYAGRRAAAQAMDDVYTAYAAGKPIVDIRAAATKRLGDQLHELAEARADMIQSLAKSEGAGDLLAQLQGTKAAVDSGRPLSLGQRILEGLPQPVTADEAVANALAKSKDVNTDIADLAPKITRYEAAKAQLTEALGDKASPDAIAHAQAFRQAQGEAANANARATAQAAENIDNSIRGVPAEKQAGGKPLLKGLAKHAQNVGAAYEMLRGLGMPLPDLHGIPVIGPILSTFLKAKVLSKVAGKFGGSFAETAEGTIAAKAATTQNRINAAVGSLLEKTGKQTFAAAPELGAAAALGHKLFDDGKKAVPYSSKPADGELPDLYQARLAELSAAMQPGAIEQAIRSRINVTDPTIVDSIIQAEQRKLQYLYDQAPKPDSPPFPGQPPWSPSKSEIIEWGHVVAASHDPAAIFERVAKGGTARPSEIECVQNCYPQLYAAAQSKLVDMLSKADAPLPYMRRVAVSSLTGIPMDSTFRPDHAAFLQNGFAAPTTPQAAPAPHPTLTSSMSIGDRTLTRLDQGA